MARVRFFAQARDAAGCRQADIEGETVGSVLEAVVVQFGPGLRDVIATSTIWVNGERADRAQRIVPSDELAVLPPVSGG
ncbi:MAG: MoaD/ThiS family protein [Acidimicrobiales bacterium]|jgi:molybdopterin synthase catalytic subunit/molybdopterin synthase sulfur carrier subunit